MHNSTSRKTLFHKLLLLQTQYNFLNDIHLPIAHITMLYRPTKTKHKGTQ